MEDRILIQCENDKQAKAFYNWFLKHGFKNLIEKTRCDIECISSNEKPGATSDPSCYYIEIQ